MRLTIAPTPEAVATDAGEAIASRFRRWLIWHDLQADLTDRPRRCPVRYPRLHQDQPERDERGPIPFPPEGRVPGRADDSTQQAERALEDAQRRLEELDELLDETIPFPTRQESEEDDGPWAA